MTARLSRKLNVFALAAIAAVTGFISPAGADDSCSSPYVWGRDSYFGDCWSYSYRHAYPEQSYRSSRHFIYARRVPHFYDSHKTYYSNFYCSPEYQAYYTYGPYMEPTQYIEARRYSSPMTRPYMPYCAGDENIGDTYPPYYNGERERFNDEAPPQDSESMNQRSPVDDAQREAELQLSKAGEKVLERGWELLRDGNAKDAMPILAEAAIMRGSDALPRLAYGLAAAMNDQDMVAAWAIRKAIAMDAEVLLRVPDDGALRQQFTDSMQQREVDDESESAGEVATAQTNDVQTSRRDELVVSSVLAVLAQDAEAMKSSLTELAAKDASITRPLAVASKAYVAQRWTDVESDTALAAKDK